MQQRLKTWLEVKKWAALICFVAAFAIGWTLHALGSLEGRVVSEAPTFRLAIALVAAGFILAVLAVRNQFQLLRQERLVARRCARDAEIARRQGETRRRAVSKARILQALQLEESRQVAA